MNWRPLLVRHVGSAVLLVASLGLPLAAPEAEAQAAPAATAWDQPKVAALAQQLADSAASIYSSVNKEKPGSTVGSGQANAYLRLKDNLRVARNQSKALAKRLADGGTREETASTYRRLMTLVRDAREEGRKMFLQKPTLDEVGRANEILDQLAPYYGEAASGEAASGEAASGEATGGEAASAGAARGAGGMPPASE
jgi:hypothetical protein